jgi:Protein of unknown function (DUF3300)
MKRLLIAIAVFGVLAGGGTVAVQKAAAPADLDTLLAPVALYPDQLLGPMLICAGNPGKVAALEEWLRSQTAKGSDLQNAAMQGGFEDCHAALVLFPQVVAWMASQSPWMSKVGTAFLNDRSAVFASIQRLRGKAREAGTLKSTPQQTVETKQTASGEQVIVIEPANPQVVYVPQYNPQVVYTQPSTVVVQQSSSSADAALAGVIGFTAGIAIGAAFDNNYYGPYGWHGGYMYNDAWDDWYDHREDAREDWQDHREDMADEYGDRSKNKQENRTDRQQSTQQQRTERQDNRQTNKSTTGTQAQAAQTQTRTGGASQESRGFSGDAGAVDRTGTKSDAFSGYSSGRSERAASSRGKSSRSSSRSGGSRRR